MVPQGTRGDCGRVGEGEPRLVGKDCQGSAHGCPEGSSELARVCRIWYGRSEQRSLFSERASGWIHVPREGLRRHAAFYFAIIYPQTASISRLMRRCRIFVLLQGAPFSFHNMEVQERRATSMYACRLLFVYIDNGVDFSQWCTQKGAIVLGHDGGQVKKYWRTIPSLFGIQPALTPVVA